MNKYEKRAIDAIANDPRLVSLVEALNNCKDIERRIRKAQRRDDVVKTVVRSMGEN